MSTTLGVHIGWDANLADQYVKYSDVSSYVASVDTQRGRSTELDDVQTGTASIVLDNSDGRFTPGRAYGKELLPDNVRTSTAWTGHSSTGFTAGPDATMSSASAHTLSWSASLKVVVSAPVTSGERIVTTSAVPVTSGLAYRGAVMACTGSGVAPAQAYIRFYDSNGNSLGNGSDPDPAWRQYPDVVRGSMPVAYYRMSDAGGNSCAPTAGRDPMVTYNVAASAAGGSWTPGGTSVAGVFNGTSSIAEPCGIPLALQTATTVELWFKASTAGCLLADAGQTFSTTQQVAISASGAPTTGVMTPVAYVGTDGYLYATAGTNANTAPGKSPYLVNDGNWHHLVIAHNGATGFCYLDGVQFFTSTAFRPLSRPILGYCSFTSPATSYASWPAKPATNWFTGSVADVALYRHAMSARVVGDHYRHGSTAAVTLQSGAGAGSPQPWQLLTAAATAPAGAVTAALEVAYLTAATAGTLYFDSFSLRQISPYYGRVRPRRRVRVFATTGQNLMPPGLNLGYQTYSGIPAGVDDNETGTWILANGTNLGFDPSTGVTTYSANSSSTSGLSLYGPSGNGISVPWMLLPGNTYTFQCQVACWRYAASSTGVTIGINTTVKSQPGSTTLFNGSVTQQHFNPGDVAWRTVSWTFTIPSTYTQPDFLFTVYTSETVSSGTTFAWQTALRNLQLIDVTNGQTIPAYQAGDATLPVFVGVADKWESTTEYSDTAQMVLSCSDMMRALGESQLAYAPQALGFRPDWNCLGSWDMGSWDTTKFGAVSPNNLVGSMVKGNANSLTVTADMRYTSTLGGPALPGVKLNGPASSGGTDLLCNPSLPQYLFSYGKLPAAASLEVWFKPYTAAGSTGMDAGDHYLCAFGPFVNLYATSSTSELSFGWNGRNVFAGQRNMGASDDVSQGGHLAFEITTSGGTSPTISIKGYYNGQLMATSTGEAFTPTPYRDGIASPGYAFGWGGTANLNDGIHNYTSAPYVGMVYAPAFYGAVNLDWSTRLSMFSVTNLATDYAAQDQVAWITAASGMPFPLVVGSDPSSSASAVDVPAFTSGTGLDAIKTQVNMTGGLVAFSRYGAVMLHDRSFRSAANALLTFDCLGATAPDTGLLWVNDIDRTWTDLQLTYGSNVTELTSFAGWSQYGYHQVQQTAPTAGNQQIGNAGAYLSDYLQPTSRIDSATFEVINNATAASALMVDIGSHVQFINLPDSAPGDGPYGAYLCWVESVKVSAKSDGGAIVPTVQVTFSPDFTYVPIM